MRLDHINYFILKEIWYLQKFSPGVRSSLEGPAPRLAAKNRCHIVWCCENKEDRLPWELHASSGYNSHSLPTEFFIRKRMEWMKAHTCSVLTLAGKISVNLHSSSKSPWSQNYLLRINSLSSCLHIRILSGASKIANAWAMPKTDQNLWVGRTGYKHQKLFKSSRQF